MLRVSLLLAAAIVFSACGGSSTSAQETTFPAESLAFRAITDVGLGTERLLFGVIGPEGERLGSPDQTVVITVSPADEPENVQTADAVFAWILEDVLGLYRVTFEFDSVGVWRALLQPSSGEAMEAFFDVLENPSAPSLGELAPVVASPTLDTRPLEELTTDPDPRPDLYELSLDDALTNGKPTVVIFSTPAYCTSSACGPILDNVKLVVDDFPGVDFVHVEVYEGFTQPGFQPTPEFLSPTVAAWKLPSEPWVFVVDEAGLIVRRYQGLLDPEELRGALKQ